MTHYTAWQACLEFPLSVLTVNWTLFFPPKYNSVLHEFNTTGHFLR